MCRICRDRVARHRHHLTYKRYKREHKRDLWHLCPVCHGAIHRLMQLHPELNYMAATYILKFMVQRGLSYAAAAQKWLARANKHAYHHETDVGIDHSYIVKNQGLSRTGGPGARSAPQRPDAPVAPE